MKKRLKRSALIFLLMVFSCIGQYDGAACYAQSKDSLARISDSSAIVPRQPDAKVLDDLRSDRSFQYEDDPIPPENPLARWLQAWMRKIRHFFSGDSYEAFWKYVLMLAALGVVVYILYKAKVLDYVFPSRAAKRVQNYTVEEENIHETDFEGATERALQAGDWRLAIRLRYLKVLQLLVHAGLIDWKPEHTNQMYVRQLDKWPLQTKFAELTRYFEYAWYGEFPVNQYAYDEMKSLSVDLIKALNEKSYV